jgi:hypothetical protein
MDVHPVSIAKPSSRVLGKMKKGATVRICKGEGMNLLVTPQTYNQITHTFSKGKGLHIALSPDEIHHNRAQGVFDRAKSVVNNVVKAAKSIVKAGVKAAAPFAKQAARGAINTGVQALAASNPEHATLAPVGVAGLSAASDAAVDKIAGQGLFAEPMGGQGFYAEPLASMRARWLRHSRERASIGIHGNLLGGALPPALIPQPYSANFQFQHTLPPAYQTFAKRGTLR